MNPDQLADLVAYNNPDGTVRLYGTAVIDDVVTQIDVDIPRAFIDLLLVNAKSMGMVPA